MGNMGIRPVADMVREAKSKITTLTPQEARTRAEADEALLVDIRDIRELDRDGRIPGAFHAPRGMLEFWIDPESPYHKPALATDKTIILFCASAGRSALSAATLQEMGVANIAEMGDGFKGWKAAGLPIEVKD